MALSTNPVDKGRLARRKRAEQILAERQAFRDPKTGETWVDDLSCAEGCPGWAVFDTDRGLGVEICDECNAAARRAKLPLLHDYEVKELPAAKRELARAQRFLREQENPRSLLTGPSWDTARQKLRGAATGARKNPRCTIDHRALIRDDAEWERLKPIGRQLTEDDEGNEYWLELRNCTCGSTLARPEKGPRENPPLETADDYQRAIAEAVKWARFKKHDRATLRMLAARYPEARALGADRAFWLGEMLGDLRVRIASADLTLSVAERNNLILEIDREVGKFRAGEAPQQGRPWTRGEEMAEQARLRQRGQWNPGAPQEAVDKYEEFHRYKPVKIGEFAGSFQIPKTMLHAGAAKWTTYRSGKVDPSTLQKPRRPVDYIHEHDAGVDVYVPADPGSLLFDTSKRVTVPAKFQSADALVKLGDSLGFCFVSPVNDEEIEAEGQDPLPELYCTPDGKCLLVVQEKAEVLAMIWGGGLGVFARGIDG